MKVLTGKQPTPWKIIIYGPPGIGKSTLASFAEKPFFIDLEFGLNNIDCAKTPRVTEWETQNMEHPGFVDSMKFFVESEYKTLVVDTVSALETLLSQKALKEYNEENNKDLKSLSEIGWNQGYDILAAQWSLVMKWFTRAQEAYKKNVILIGHSTVQKVDDPTTDSYDRYSLDTHKKCLPTLINNVDAVLFAKLETIVKEKENSSKLRGVTTGDRILHCLDQPSYLAKNRFGLDHKVPMKPEIFKALP